MATPDDKLDIYARVSRLGDERQRSTGGQADDCTVRVEDRGARVGVVHVDEGRSAWNPRVKRPGWDQLMKRLESGDTGGVVVFDLARFSRRPIEGERLIAAAERGLLVLDSEGEYDLTTASGKKAFRDQLSTAAYESDRLSTRVKRGKRLKAMRGEANLSSRPFGFEPDGVTIRESEADELRRLVAEVLAGDSQDAMVIDLNERGVLTSYGGRWTRTSLRQVLTRARNAGLIVYDGELTGKRLPGEPIIDQETWERVCALYASRRRGRPVSAQYTLSGEARCGRCWHVLTGRPRPHLTPYPDGEVRRDYWCQKRAHAGGCGGLSVDMRGLEAVVREFVAKTLADPRHASAVAAAARKAADRLAVLRAEIAELENTALELAGRLGRGEIKLARHDAAVAPLDRRLAVLTAERDELEATAPERPEPGSLVRALRDWEMRWDAAAPPERRALTRQALRGRLLVVGPADPSDRTNVRMRVSIEDPKAVPSPNPSK